MQLSDIRTRVRYHLREATASVWTDAELLGHINQAQKFVANLANPLFLPKLVKIAAETIASDKITIPTDFLKMAGDVWVTTTAQIYRFIDSRMAITLRYGTTSGHLLHSKHICYIDENELMFNPTASGDATFAYVQYPDDLSGDSDVSDIAESLIEFVVIYAASLAMIKTRNTSLINTLNNMVNGQIQALNTMATREQKTWR